MVDALAVCTETLEWVAYGECGHLEVCSSCVDRLRFICLDPHCYICHTLSSFVFVTKWSSSGSTVFEAVSFSFTSKALGDFTRMINDFSVLSAELKEGRSVPYWFHQGTHAFFDEVDHYRMVKAMCMLSSSFQIES